MEKLFVRCHTLGGMVRLLLEPECTAGLEFPYRQGLPNQAWHLYVLMSILALMSSPGQARQARMLWLPP